MPTPEHRAMRSFLSLLEPKSVPHIKNHEKKIELEHFGIRLSEFLAIRNELSKFFLEFDAVDWRKYRIIIKEASDWVVEHVYPGDTREQNMRCKVIERHLNDYVKPKRRWRIAFEGTWCIPPDFNYFVEMMGESFSEMGDGDEVIVSQVLMSDFQLEQMPDFNGF